MYKLWIILIFISSLKHCVCQDYSGPGWCSSTTYSLVSYQEACGSWLTDLCTKYRAEASTAHFCCEGYTGTDCDEFFCDGKSNPDACSKAYTDPIIIRPNTKVYDSGGTCTSPDNCTDCNDGFYSNGPYCEICGELEMCNHRRCTDLDNIECLWCEGDTDGRQYYRTYTHEISGGKFCNKTCSWAADSSRCYPGVCGTGTSDPVSDCVCAENFGGDHCENILNTPNITLNSAVFFNDDESSTAKNDPNYDSDDHPTVWTNVDSFTRVDLALTATYTPPADTRDADHYVTDFKVGLEEMIYSLDLYEGGTWSKRKTTSCTDAGRDKAPQNVECSESVSLVDWLPLEHDDRIVYTVSAKNGGYVDVENRDNYPVAVTTDKYYYNGQTVTRSFSFHWDMEFPYHCSETQDTGTADCPYPVEIVKKDITSDPVIEFTFGGWLDDLAGIHEEYTFQVFEVKAKTADSIALTDGLTAATILDEEINNVSGKFRLTSPGVYSIHISAYDKTKNSENEGNYRAARTLLFFDDQASIDIQDDYPMACAEASKNSSYQWVVQNTSTVTITWTNRFINSRHVTNKWFAEIEPYTATTVYEDFDGERTTAAIDNEQGVITFEVGYEVFSPNLSDFQNLTSMADLHAQRDVLDIIWNDGDKLVLTVKATDIIGSSNNDTIVVYKDATPPLIKDLWLTKGDRLNVSVHPVEELTEMTIEWEAYDLHSGIESLYWRIFDNYTGTDILHGHENLVAQRTDDYDACLTKYETSARGANCYCTNFEGCYHQHFQVIPAVKVSEGLFPGKDVGVHDYDYYIEIAVTNYAQLVTVLRKKITIDVTPAHTGIVHDGMIGSPEVDYQQGNGLSAHWDQFFDRESGVLFYQYIAGTSCANKADFDLKHTNPNLVETYDTSGSYTAPGPGTYYFTVVAYNRALDPSDPVCSDGVTIDTTVPTIKEVKVENALVIGGLVVSADNSSYWILSSDRTRRRISNPTPECITKATEKPDLDLYPVARHDDLEVEVDGTIFCLNSTGAPSSAGLALSTSNVVSISWMVDDLPAKIYDFEVGLASTSGSAAPDLLAFSSSKQNPHTRIEHAYIPDGTEFYIIIKAISGSNVEGSVSVGPCYMDTTPPEFTGTISLDLSGQFLVTEWTPGAFSDSEEPFSLVYEFAIGNTALGTQIQQYQPLSMGGSCIDITTPTCTAVKTSTLNWYLHGNHKYYMSIKVSNTAGLVKIKSAGPYIHNVQIPDEGVVFDLDPAEYDSSTPLPLQDIEDVDFHTDASRLVARWYGFTHPHLTVTYTISIGTTKGGNDIKANINVGTSTAHEETGLRLQPFQKYFFTVTAVTSVGSVSVSSDGVAIVTEYQTLIGIEIHDGVPCNLSDQTFSHHEQDHRVPCEDDIDTQSSTNSMRAYWTIPDSIHWYTPDAYFKVEQRSQVTATTWTEFRPYEYINSTSFSVSTNELTLNPGFMYRIKLKLCAKQTCFKPVSTGGVMIISNPPVTGSISVEHQDGPPEKLIVTMDKFYDPDIPDTIEKYAALDRYEYAITDNSMMGNLYTNWTSITVPSGDPMNFEVTLTGNMDFSKCKRFSMRAFNQVKMYSLVSTEIKQCNAFNPKLIVPNIVIDAKGLPGDSDETGQPIILPRNALWETSDVDYTPYSNIISAVWPTLRHREYTYAVLTAGSVDVTSYYKQMSGLSLDDPCSHVDSIRCGTTESEYMNEEFTGGELVHGNRYIVCVHADRKLIPHDAWTEELVAVSTCSDGIVVDLTPPQASDVWISYSPHVRYQSSITELYVNWESFIDVEEYSTGPNPTGVMDYTVGIGTTIGANDVVPFQSVGVVNHKAFHGLRLQNGQAYYATVTATDFAGRSTSQTSSPVIVDYTPPSKSDKPIYLPGRHITSQQEVKACWTSVFEDLESGINHYEWYIGSQPGYYDVMDRVTVINDECSQSDQSSSLDLVDGHSYYINVEAFNNAGLTSVATSWAFVVDTTPPSGGHVYDGQRSLLTGDVKDVDFQGESKFLYGYWEGFHDTHSVIQEYYVSVGTCQNCDNVLAMQALGIVEDFVLGNVHLGVGIRYYITVTACNTAELCTSVSSDGVMIDNSPPKAGVVQDGTGYQDIQYQSLRSYISAKWYGFQDPQSGIEKYVWRAGLTKGGDNVMSARELHVTEIAVMPDLSPLLPVGTTIYITVRAYNRAGLWSEASSNGFKVDNTKPMISGPTFPANFGVDGLTQIYRTTMKVEWTASDAESYIERQYLSIKSHKGGEFELSSIQVNGIVRNYIFTDLRLHDGVTYYVTLIACNGAQLCSTSVSNGMFVDTTPPSRGMFAVSTDHAADLTRHEKGHMTWSSRALYLAWLGFSDIHSGIAYYKVTVGSGYLKDDLSDDTITKYSHTTTYANHFDEGYLQLYTIPTLSLKLYDTVYVTIWAVNKVGLRSEMIHSAFNKIAGGTLQLVRRCDTFSCVGHCVCAPQDQRCPYDSSLHCNSVTDSNPNDLIAVNDVNGYSLEDQEITSSDTVLRGYWQFIMRQGIEPRWFEWSVGYTSGNFPDGIYNAMDDRVWHDAGQLTTAIYSSKYGFYLTNGQRYSVFVRLWYDGTTFADFKTDGILISTGSLQLTTTGGKAVTEKVTGTSVRDVDYIRQGRPMTFDWEGKFANAATLIKEFKIYISTFPGGHDFLILSDTLPGTTTQYNMSRLSYEAGVTYYVNIVAYSYSGVHVTATSDGFTVDFNKPSSGIVYDGIGLLDIEYQNSSLFVGAHWHGFSDTESGIKAYYWCVGTTTSKTECGIRPWENVGLHVSVSRYLTTNIEQGSRIYHKVYALDGVGLVSDTVVSDGAIVDTSGPIPQELIHMMTNLVSNPSFEVTQGSIISWETLSTSTDICTYSRTFHHPADWTAGSQTCLTAVTSTKNLANDGNFFVFLRGELKQTLTSVTAGKVYRVRFYTSHLPIWEAYIANKEGFVKFGDEYHVFLIYTKSYRKDDNGTDTREDTSWHRHTFYFTATTNSPVLTIGSMDMKTGLFFDNIQVNEVLLDPNSTSSGHVVGHIEYIHEWSSIHGSWSFVDFESPVVEYLWAIGYTEGGTQIQTFKTEGRRNFGLNNKVSLVHNTFVYITVLATNAAGIRSIAYSSPILVDLTPPQFIFVYDGLGVDEDAWEINKVSANWKVEDPESGVSDCQYAIGYLPDGSDLHPWTTTTANSVTMEFDYSDLERLTIYTSVKCQNAMGISNTSSSDGVRISTRAPSTASAVLTPYYLSANEYSAKDGYQSNTDTVRLKWRGFTDSLGIDNYMVTFEGDLNKQEKVSFPTQQDLFYVQFYNLRLPESYQRVHVQAINVLFKKSERVSRNMSISITPPALDTSNNVNVVWKNNKFNVTWISVFISPSTVWYEVSAGTYRGGANIIQWTTTSNQYLVFGLPPSITDLVGIDIFVTVRGISASGLYTGADTSIRLPT